VVEPTTTVVPIMKAPIILEPIVKAPIIVDPIKLEKKIMKKVLSNQMKLEKQE